MNEELEVKQQNMDEMTERIVYYSTALYRMHTSIEKLGVDTIF